MPYSEIGDLEVRIDDYEQAMVTFARLHEELTDLRETVTLSEAASRIYPMLKLNAETLDAIKQSLTIVLMSLRHREHALAKETASRHSAAIFAPLSNPTFSSARS